MLKADLILETDPTYVPEIVPGTDAYADASPSALTTPTDVRVSDQFWSLDPRNIRAERISGLIVAAVFLTGGLIALAILWSNIGFGLIWYSISLGAVLLITLSFIGSFYWPAVEHRHASWRLDEEGLEIRRGVFWRHQITIPLGRVQHADVSQGPLQRPFELGTLTIHTAGTQNASVELKGLSHATAIELRDKIVVQRKDENVV